MSIVTYSLPKKLTYETVGGSTVAGHDLPSTKPQKQIRSKLLRLRETAGVLTTCSITNL
jgi:hypothetical protein